MCRYSSGLTPTCRLSLEAPNVELPLDVVRATAHFSRVLADSIRDSLIRCRGEGRIGQLRRSGGTLDGVRLLGTPDSVPYPEADSAMKLSCEGRGRERGSDTDWSTLGKARSFAGR